MGSIVIGNCECGYKTEELFLGGGMMNYLEVCKFPHYCQECHTFFIGNIYDKNLVCENCQSENIIAYDDKRACTFMENEVFNDYAKDTIGRDLKLSATNNLCPQCKNYSLNFKPIGNWD